jgi:hypothetical protein
VLNGFILLGQPDATNRVYAAMWTAVLRCESLSYLISCNQPGAARRVTKVTDCRGRKAWTTHTSSNDAKEGKQFDQAFLPGGHRDHACCLRRNPYSGSCAMARPGDCRLLCFRHLQQVRGQEGGKHQKLPTGELPRFRCHERQSDGGNASKERRNQETSLPANALALDLAASGLRGASEITRA